MFLGYIHSFRALAIFFIVAGHSIDFFQWSELNYGVERFLRILMSNGSVLFVFIAGYLFQHLSGKYEHKKYFITKIKNVITPYFLVSIPAIVIFIFFIPRETVWQGFYENPQWLQVGYFYLTGLHSAQLWFIPMITLFFLSAPLLIVGDKSKLFYWVLPLTIIASCFIDRGLPLQSFIHFFSVYLLGMFCSHYKYRLNEMLQQSSIIFTLTTIVACCVYIEYYYMKGTMTYVNYLQKISMALLFLGSLVRLGEHTDSKLIRIIADTSFGVFFIHSYVLTAGKLITEKLMGEKVHGELLLYPVVTLLVLFSCVAVIVLLQKLLGTKSRYFVGS